MGFQSHWQEGDFHTPTQTHTTAGFFLYVHVQLVCLPLIYVLKSLCSVAHNYKYTHDIVQGIIIMIGNMVLISGDIETINI